MEIPKKLLTNMPFFNVQKVDKPVKALFKQISDKDDRLLFAPLKLKHEELGDMYVSVHKHERAWNRHELDIEDRSGYVLGKEIFSIDVGNKKMFGFDIFVDPYYRKKKLAELLRLFSIMIMNENKSPRLKIYSKNTAVYFHSKYKFEPQIWQFMDRDKALESIAENEAKEFIEMSRFAKNIQDRVRFFREDGAKQRELCEETQELMQDYINLAMQKQSPEKNYPLKWGMDMVLTKEKVESNKEFYNPLFERHGLDYRL